MDRKYGGRSWGMIPTVDTRAVHIAGERHAAVLLGHQARHMRNRLMQRTPFEQDERGICDQKEKRRRDKQISSSFLLVIDK